MATMIEERPRSVWRNPERWRESNMRTVYDWHTDTYYRYALPIEPAGSYNFPLDDNGDSELLALVKGDTGEMIGFQVENFRSVWIRRQPEFNGLELFLQFYPILNPLYQLWEKIIGHATDGILKDVNRESSSLLEHMCPT